MKKLRCFVSSTCTTITHRFGQADTQTTSTPAELSRLIPASASLCMQPNPRDIFSFLSVTTLDSASVSNLIVGGAL